MSPLLYTLPEAAAKLQLNERYLQRRCAKGELPHIWVARQYRFTDEHLAEIIRRLEAETPRKSVPRPVLGGVAHLVPRKPRGPNRRRKTA
ncbi:helix-turn-helix domain-containing protein [Nocardiopsis sp. NPDC007018]|uniref:helix-turn-helix domain-containing protein n=1 Tax=Nocardiopsis sp. NPDC007018 TaxID=3155721 RepID=UPI0033F5D639